MRYFLLLVITAFLASCSGGQGKDAAVSDAATADSLAQSAQVYADAPMDIEQTAQHGAHAYHVLIHREACDSLPTHTDEFGTVFADYTVRVTVRRDSKAGSVLFDRTFTKQAFAAYVPKSDLQRSILDGIGYDRIDADGLHFGVSIAQPDSEGGTRLSLIIDFAGGSRITAAEAIDERAEDSPQD